MQKRMSQLLDAFQHLKFEQCLRMSDQILKKLQKTDNKKKNNFTDLDMQNLYLTRIGSLASLGQLHQANQLINQKFQKPIISQQFSFLFLQICALALDRRLGNFTLAIHQSKQKKQQIDINRYLLLAHKFSQLSRIFLAKYANSKDKYLNRNDCFAQIYLQYLQLLQNNNMIGFARDQVILEKRVVNFKIVTMFLGKFVEMFNGVANPQKGSTQEYNKYLKTKRSITDIKLKILIHEGKSEQVRKSLIQFQKDIKQRIFIYLRSLKKLTQQTEQNRIFWRQQYLKIFRANLDLDNYQPIYDYSVQFINEILKESQFNFEEFGELKRIGKEELYSFKENDKEQVQNFISSLFSQYELLREREGEDRKKDFYKIAMKNCLLLLIYILGKGKKINYLQDFLLQYKEEYGKKLTFPDQITDYFNNASIFTPEFIEKFKVQPKKIQNSEDRLIWVINYERLFAINPLQHTLQQNYIQWQRVHSLYLKNLIQVQQQKKLQKGERYLSDELLTIQADSIRKYTQQVAQKQLSQTQRQQLYLYILGRLETSIVKSCSNHDTKLRAVYFCNKLNYHEESGKILQSLDIKAVQYETLGYLYLKNFINFCSWDSNEHILIKMVKSYQEAFKENLEYSYKALCAESFNECQENLSYYHHIQRSYNFIVVLFTLYMKNKGKDNCEFYLKEILERIKEYTNNKNNKKLTFNADFKVFKNYTQFTNNPYGDFYGIYNNVTILENQTKIKLLIANLIKNEPQQKITQLKKSIVFTESTQQVYNFSSYDLFQRQINYKYSGEKVHHERQTGLQLKLTNKINRIILRICDLVSEIRKGEGNLYQELYEKIKQEVKELNGLLNDLTWRQQTLFLPKIRFHISEIIPLLSAQIQAFSAKKKKAEGQGQKKLLCQELITYLIQSFSQNIKLQQRLPVDKKYLTQTYLHRDQLLERVTKMTANQYKKLYKLKL